jgi:Domain of unknown function (DUF6532)
MSQTRKAVLTQPFKHNGIIALIRHIVFTNQSRGGSVAQRFEALFPEVLVGGVHKPAMPDAIVCFAATVVSSLSLLTYTFKVLTLSKVHASLNDWKNGYHQPTHFSSDANVSIFAVMIEVLETIRERHNGAAYNHLMASIYEEARSAQ